MAESTARTRRWRGIRTRIIAVAWVPSLLLLTGGIAVSAVLAYQGMRIAAFTDRFNADTPGVSAIAMQLMAERRASVVYLADPRHDPQVLAEIRQELDAISDGVIEAAESRAADDPEIYTQLVTDGSRALAALPGIRQRIDNREVGLVEVEDFYTEAVDAIAQSLFLIAEAEPVPRAAVALVGNVALYRANNLYLQADELALAASIGPGLTQEEYTRFVVVYGGYQSLLDQAKFSLDATGAAAVDNIRVNPSWQRLDAAHQAILLRGPVSPEASTETSESTDATDTADDVATPLPEPGAWNEDTVLLMGEFATVGMGAAERATGLSHDAGTTQKFRALIVGVTLLLLGVVVLVLAARTSGKIVSRLRRLREESLQLSRERLPGVVQRLRRGEDVNVSTEVVPLDLGGDEIGQVGDAFNQVQKTAIASAVGEAQARAGLRTVFINIAHRSQGLVHRQLGLLDQAERAVEDPEQLSVLFELDHLTTRARRNAENLVILGGGQAGRQWRNPVPLIQVVRSAISEAHDYARITLGDLPSANLVGSAVADTIHVIAELVDNATIFSPPASRIEVSGNMVGRGLVIEIEDQGLGIEASQLHQLNEMLQQPPDFQVMALSDEPRLGIFVVAQLAARQGIRVTLTPSPAYGGIRAVVLIPTGLITTDPADTDLNLLDGSTSEEGTIDGSDSSLDAPQPPPVVVPPPPLPPAGPAHASAPAPNLGTAGDSGLFGTSAEAGQNRAERPTLPRRARQTHVVPQLRDTKTAVTEPASDTPPTEDPEVSRSHMAAFQSGTRRARKDDQTPEG